MSNNKKVHDDPLDEVRHIRDEHAKKFNYDVDAIIQDIKQFSKEKNLKTVALPPRRVNAGKKTG